MASYVLEGPKWTSGVVTWSFADTSAANEASFTGPIGVQYQLIIEAAIARWESVVPVTFEQVQDGTPGTDLLIGWGSLTAPQAGETDYSYTLGATESFLPGMTIRLEDPALLPLSTGSDPTYQGSETSLYQLALHEVGHALGLGLATDPSAVMYLYLGLSNTDLNASDVAGAQSLYGAPSFAMTDATTNTPSYPTGTIYTGPVSYLQQQFIYGGSDNVAIATSAPNVFIHGGSGNDAIAVSSGQNVLDGGQGSNFLVGGTGTDTFFVDARGGQVTWDTLVNFHAGDAVTIWGFDPSVSTKFWDGNSGAAGYTGPTLRAALNGTTVTSSVTFTGLSAADQSKLVFQTGTEGAGPYLYITEQA